MSKEVIKRLQTDLKEFGLYIGAIDGIWGDSSQTAWDGLKELAASRDKARIPSTRIDITMKLAWSAKVSEKFVQQVRRICDDLSIPDPNDLMACMAWESGETFSPSIKNGAGSGAVGLIQFMPATAKGLGTTTAALVKLTAEEQLNYVYKYFLPYKGRLKNLGDLYMAILWPAGIGKSDDYVLWEADKRPTTYLQNKGLDVNKDGAITRGECMKKVNEKLTKGLQPENMRVA